MKTVIRKKYGNHQILNIEDREKPEPKEDQVRIKVMDSTINSYDTRLMKGDPFLVRFSSGLTKPKNQNLGCDVAGVIEKVGPNVEHFKVGDEVFTCLADGNGDNAYSEYVCVTESILAPKPKNLSYEVVATIPMAGLTALQAIRDFGKIQSGQKVLINGATGGVGSFAVQSAKLFGAHVTAVCRTEKEAFVRSIGADTMIDYTKENILESKVKYDLIIDVVANHSFKEYKPILTETGRCVMVGFSTIPHMIKTTMNASQTKQKDQKIVVAMANNTMVSDLTFMAEQMSQNKLTAVIDQIFPLTDIHQAFNFYEEEHLEGKVVITM